MESTRWIHTYFSFLSELIAIIRALFQKLSTEPFRELLEVIRASPDRHYGSPAVGHSREKISGF